MKPLRLEGTSIVEGGWARLSVSGARGHAPGKDHISAVTDQIRWANVENLRSSEPHYAGPLSQRSRKARI
jgi:hypothetical protein